MTENQRNYLADLAGQKGVRLHDTDNWSVAKASEEIERLKEMPDAVFDELTNDQINEINNRTERTREELRQWGFNNG